METNRIVEELRARAAENWNQEQKAWFEVQAKDARPVKCVPMCEAFTPEQMAFIRGNFKAKQKMCYKNAAGLVILSQTCALSFPQPMKYVEGFVYCRGFWPIEHAFIKVGDLYVDPTFERALHRDVRKEMYVSCIELDPLTMAIYISETGRYGDLYYYDFLCKNRPKKAAEIRALNPFSDK